MATSPYFNHVSHAGQQKLTEDLIIEAIQQRGIDCHYFISEYLPDETYETMFNEAEMNTLKECRELEFYVESISNFAGSGDLFAKFGGLTFDDTATLVCSEKRYKEALFGLREKPEPGDIIFIDFANQAFEVMKTLQDEDYRQWGKNYVYRIEVAKYKYGHETLDTGYEPFDGIADAYEIPELDVNNIPTGVIETNDIRDRREYVKDAPQGSTDIVDFGRK